MTTMKNPKQLAVWALLAVAVGYALLNLSIRLMDAGFEPFTQTYLRIFLGAVIAYFLFRKRIRPKAVKTIPRKDWLVILLMGVVGYSAGVLFVTLGALNAKLVNVSVLTSTIPFFVVVYSFLVLGKKTSKKMLLLLAVSFVGVAMVATKTFPPVIDSLGIGELFILLSAGAFAWYSVGRKMLSNHLNNYEISVLTMLVAAMSSFTVAMLAGEPLNLAAFLNPLVLLGLAIGTGFNIMASLFENFAFQHISAVAGSQLLLIENAIAPVLGFFLYSEIFGVYEAIGGLLIVGSVMLSARLAKQH